MNDKERDDAITEILNRVKGMEKAINGLTGGVSKTGQAVNGFAGTLKRHQGRC